MNEFLDFLKKSVFSKIFLIIFIGLVLIEASLHLYRWHLVSSNIGQHEQVLENTKIILSLGESTTYGHGVDRTSNYSALLEKELNKDTGDQEYKVLNLGWSGASSAQILQCFKDALKEYDPEIVLVCMGHNDFFIELNPEGMGLEKVHPFFIEDEIIKPKMKKKILIWQILKNYYLIIKKLKKRRRAIVSMRLPGFKKGNEVNEIPGRKRKIIGRSLEKNYMEIAKICRERDMKLVIVGYINGDIGDRNVDNVSRQLKKLSSALNVPFVDNAIKDREILKMHLFKDQFHPNEKGHRFIMNNIIQTIKEAGLLEQGLNP